MVKCKKKNLLIVLHTPFHDNARNRQLKNVYDLVKVTNKYFKF